MIPLFTNKLSRVTKMVNGVFIPQGVWNTILGIILTAIVTILLSVHSAFGTTQDKVLLQENRLTVLETESENQSQQLSSIQSQLSTNTVKVDIIQKDVEAIRKFLMDTKKGNNNDS